MQAVLQILLTKKMIPNKRCCMQHFFKACSITLVSQRHSTDNRTGTHSPEQHNVQCFKRLGLMCGGLKEHLLHSCSTRSMQVPASPAHSTATAYR